ncbi:hypothetical protein GCM10027026_04470 [Myroides odoratimimus subsp. xuanwuensis]
MEQLGIQITQTQKVPFGALGVVERCLELGKWQCTSGIDKLQQLALAVTASRNDVHAHSFPPTAPIGGCLSLPTDSRAKPQRYGTVGPACHPGCHDYIT